MKTESIIIIVVVIFVVGFLVWRKKSDNIKKAATEFVKLESTVESTKHLPLLSNNWIVELEKK